MAEARAHRLRGLRNRDATLAAATDLWAEYGYAGTSLAMIATRVGISQAGLLHHFGSKDQLLLAAVERHGQHHREQLAQLDGLVGLAAFEALFELVGNSLIDLGPSRLFAALQRDGMIEDNPAAQFIDDHYAILRQYLLSAIERGISAGTVVPDIDATTVVNFTMAICNGISHSGDHRPEMARRQTRCGLQTMWPAVVTHYFRFVNQSVPKRCWTRITQRRYRHG